MSELAVGAMAPSTVRTCHHSHYVVYRIWFYVWIKFQFLFLGSVSKPIGGKRCLFCSYLYRIWCSEHQFLPIFRGAFQFQQVMDPASTWRNFKRNLCSVWTLYFAQSHWRKTCVRVQLLKSDSTCRFVTYSLFWLADCPVQSETIFSILAHSFSFLIVLLWRTNICVLFDLW